MLRLGDKGGKINMYLFVAATAEFAGSKLVEHHHKADVDEFLPQS
jgi:hypothetical protein